MSHFSVLVISTSGQDNVEDQLAKYEENLQVERYVHRTKGQVIAEGRQRIEDYKNGLYATYINDPVKYASECNNVGHIKYISEEFPKKLLWSDEQIYLDGLEYVDVDDIGPDGEVYSTSNPNAKWDWWLIGGRFRGSLITYDGVGLLGRAGAFDNEPIASDGVDQCKKKDLTEATFFNPDAYGNAIKFWNDYVETHGNPTDPETFTLYNWEYYVNRYGTKERYAHTQSLFGTYAVVIDGEWKAPGEMGYFGASDDTDESWMDWVLNYKERFIDPLPDCALLTVVDCHI